MGRQEFLYFAHYEILYLQSEENRIECLLCPSRVDIYPGKGNPCARASRQYKENDKIEFLPNSTFGYLENKKTTCMELYHAVKFASVYVQTR